VVAEVDIQVVGDLLDLCLGQGLVETSIALSEGLESGAETRPEGHREIR
jgi:hypothetical protein